MHLFLFSVVTGYSLVIGEPLIAEQKSFQMVKDKPIYHFGSFPSMQQEGQRNTSFSPYSAQRRNVRALTPRTDKKIDFAELLVSIGDNPTESETIFEEAEVPEHYEKEVLMSSLMANANASEARHEDLDEALQSAIFKELDDQLSA